MTSSGLFIFINFLDFVHIHDFPLLLSFSWLFLDLFILWLSLFLVNFHDFLRVLFIFHDVPCFYSFFMTFEFCSFCMTFWDFVHFSWLFEIWSCPWLLRFVHVQDFLRFCSFSWLFEIFFSWRCGTEGWESERKGFFKCFFLMTLPIKWWLKCKISSLPLLTNRVDNDAKS